MDTDKKRIRRQLSDTSLNHVAIYFRRAVIAMKTTTILLRQVVYVLGALAIIAFQFGIQAEAQTTTGTIYGTVVDASGAIISNASVVATQITTGISHTAISNNSGEYVFPALNPGSYTVSARVAGFKSVTQQGIVLSTNQNVHANFSLIAGAVDQTITVNAGTTLVDTRESQLGTTVDQRRIEELPLNGRDVYDLVQLVPGVTNYSADTVTGSRVGANFSVNDLPTTETNYFLDGTPDLSFYQNGGDLLPNPDAVQEFRLLTSNFDAEFGRAPGGVVNVITRSGTKSFHGMAYEYLRNNIFNSKAYFQAGSAASLKQNQFGGNIGGPLLPHGRTFFFLSYEGLLVHTPAVIGPTQIVTATTLERTGNFSASKVKPTLPAGTNCGTKAAPVICPAALDPVAQNLLAFVPVENTGSTSTTQQNANANSTVNQGLGRIDYQLTPAHQIEAMFFNSRGTSAVPNVGVNQILDYSGMSQYENQVNAALLDTWTISAKAVNNLRGFYSQNLYVIDNLYQNHLLPDLGSNAPEGGIISAPPAFLINGYWKMGTNQSGPSNISQLSFGLVDVANLTRGRHEIKIGASYIWNHYQNTGGQQSNGIFTFTGAATGNALADFLEGRANSLAQSSIVRFREYNYDPSLFVQDDWQVTQRLNLNLGLRWEVFAPYLGNKHSSTFSPNIQSKIFPTAPIGLVYIGDRGVPPGIYDTQYNRFAPRLGFAYDVFGSGRTSLRGGFGIFYSEPTAAQHGIQGQPFTLSVTTNKLTNLVNPYSVTGVDPFPFVFNPANPKFVSGGTTAAAPRDGRGTSAYVEEYNLTLEQQLGKQWGMSIGYVGNAGREFQITHDINAPTYVPGAATTTAAINARRPYEPTPSTFVFGAINLQDDANNFRYNGLQTTLRGRVGSRFTLQASYVWSKGISYEGPVVDGRDIQKNRGLGSSDIRNNFSASFLYRLPDVQSLGFFGKEVLSGWQINDLTQIHSGTPFTVISGVDTNLDGVVNDRVDIVGNPYNANAHTRAQKIQGYLNPSGFATPTGPYGNEQNNSLIGPMFVNTNLSVFKIFPLYREWQMQFRTEAFNALNNVNLGTPVANLQTLNQQSTSIPQITSQVGQPRQVQFALKLLF